MLWLQLAITGLQVGAMYALTAVGFSLIFGSTRIFHFAHGATCVLAAYVFYWMNLQGLPVIVSIIGCAAIAVAFGLFMDRFIYAPIQRDKGSFFTVFVASYGIGIVVQNVVGMIFGRSFVTIDTPLSQSVEMIPGLYVSPLAWISLVVTAVFYVALEWLLRRTHVGLALRALADNPENVRIYGMDPRRLSSVAFAIGAVLVVPAAIITGSTAGLSPSMGSHIMLISLAATIVGGIGSIRGAMVAGFILGLAETLSLLWVDAQWTEAVTFAILFLFIILRPAGLFGRASVH